MQEYLLSGYEEVKEKLENKDNVVIAGLIVPKAGDTPFGSVEELFTQYLEAEKYRKKPHPFLDGFYKARFFIAPKEPIRSVSALYDFMHSLFEEKYYTGPTCFYTIAPEEGYNQIYSTSVGDYMISCAAIIFSDPKEKIPGYDDREKSIDVYIFPHEQIARWVLDRQVPFYYNAFRGGWYIKTKDVMKMINRLKLSEG